MKIILSALLAIGLAGCADTHNVIRQKATTAIQVKQSDKVLVAISKDGYYATKTYPGSGAATSRVIASALSGLPVRVEIAPQYMAFESALQEGRQRQAAYLIYPTILAWEDRATEWSGIPDKVKVKIEIVDVVSGAKLDEGVVDGKSGLATFGGDHPEDLLPKPVATFLDAVFIK